MKNKRKEIYYVNWMSKIIIIHQPFHALSKRRTQMQSQTDFTSGSIGVETWAINEINRTRQDGKNQQDCRYLHVQRSTYWSSTSWLLDHFIYMGFVILHLFKSRRPFKETHPWKEPKTCRIGVKNVSGKYKVDEASIQNSNNFAFWEDN